MNKPFSPKQTCQFFVLFYGLFSAFFIYSYMSMSRLTVHSYLPYRPFKSSNPIKQPKKNDTLSSKPSLPCLP